MLGDIKSLLKHSSIYGFSNLLQKGIGFIMIPVYTHYLTPGDYGILELMDLTINIISMIMGMRMGSAIIRYYHHYESPEDKQEVFSTALIFVVVSTLFLVCALEFFTRPISGLVLGSPDYFRYFQIIFISMGFQTISTVPENWLLTQKKSLAYSIISIGTLFSYLSLNILFIVVYRMGVMGMLLSMIITKFFNTSALLILIRKDFRISFSREKLANMIWFGLPLIPESFCMFIIHFSDRFFVQKFCHLDQLGQYSLGYKFGMMLSYLVAEPFFRIWNTQRFEIAKNDNAQYTFAKFFTYFSFIMLFGALGISVFIEEVVQIIAPDEYQGASAVVFLIVMSYVFYGMSNYFRLGIMLTYTTKYAAYVNMLSAFLNLIFNWYFIKNYGILGASFATLLTFFSHCLFTLLISQRLYYVPFEYKRILLLLAVSGIIYGLSEMIHMPFAAVMITQCLLMLLFPALLYICGFFRQDELEKIKELLCSGLSGFRKKIRKDKIGG